MKPGTLVRLRENDALGPGRLQGAGNHGTMLVELLHHAREFQVQRGRLERYPLYVGQRVTLTSSDKVFVVREVLDLGEREFRRCILSEDEKVIVSDEEEGETIPESMLVPTPPDVTDPISFFEALQWDRPHHFFARSQLMYTATQWNEASEGIPALLGARVRPLGHQLYAARRVLGDRVPRFVLADEVGLGKTVEAGLVIQSLVSADPHFTVLILAPGSMSRQWLCELYLRFGGRAFAYVAGGQLGEVRATERRRWLSAPRLIVSTTALLESELLRKTLLERAWGLVVVDEAHQIPPGHLLYPVLRELSRRSTGFLGLSATPSKREIQGFVGLLSLVAPEAYSPEDVTFLQRRLEERRQIWGVLSSTMDIVEAARAEEGGWPPDQAILDFIINDWNDVLPEDSEVARMLDHVREGDIESLDELVAYVQEHFRVDHRILRTRRRTLERLGTAFAKRELRYLKYKPSAPESLLAEHFVSLLVPDEPTEAQRMLLILYHQALSTTPAVLLDLLNRRAEALDEGLEGDAAAVVQALASDPGPREEEHLRLLLIARAEALPGERSWLSQAEGLAQEWHRADGRSCARHSAVVNQIAEFLSGSSGAKALVFSQDRAVVEAFSHAMQVLAPHLGSAVFHHGLSDKELEEAALRFQRDPHPKVLVCDELGGEGRNFEIADWVVHLDTPLLAGRIEQRIGRLDRMGRAPDRPVRSVLVRGPSRIERALQDIHESAFSVFTRSVGGLEFVLPRLQNELRQALGNGEEPSEISRRLKAEVDATLQEVDEDFERSLDSSRQHLEQARELAEMLEQTAAEDEERAIRHWLNTLGVQVWREPESIRFDWLASSMDEPLPGDEAQDGNTPHGTFDRAVALHNESLQFFAPGHRLVDAALAALRVSRRGRAAAVIRRLGPAHRDQYFLVLIGTSRLDTSEWEEQQIPAGLRTRAHRFLWPAAQTCCLRLDRTALDPPELVRDHALEKELTRPYMRNQHDRALEIEQLISVIEPSHLWSVMRAGAELGIRALNERLVALREEAADELAASLRSEMGYYRGLLRRGTADEQEAASMELELRERLLRSVRRARVQLDGAALIIGG